MKHLLFFIIFLYYVSPSFSEEDWTLCDEYASNPEFISILEFKNYKKKGVSIDLIDFKLAEKSCNDMIALHPNVIRFKYLLGRVYHSNLNINDAVTYYKLAANNNYLPALISLGRMYYFAEDVKEDIKNALYYLLKAEEYGDNFPQVYNLLGYIYDLDDLNEENELKAFNYYLKAKDKGSLEAVYNIAQCYHFGDCNQE